MCRKCTNAQMEMSQTLYKKYIIHELYALHMRPSVPMHINRIQYKKWMFYPWKTGIDADIQVTSFFPLHPHWTFYTLYTCSMQWRHLLQKQDVYDKIKRRNIDIRFISLLQEGIKNPVSNKTDLVLKGDQDVSKMHNDSMLPTIRFPCFVYSNMSAPSQRDW